MKKIDARISILIITLGFFSCSGFDDNFEDLEEYPKLYELAEIRWKLVDGDSSTFVELTVPEQIYINQSDTTIAVEVEPLREIRGSSTFSFEEPNIFMEINLPETHVNAPRYIEILSESYSYTDDSLELEGRWTGTFYGQLENEVVVNEIE